MLTLANENVLADHTNKRVHKLCFLRSLHGGFFLSQPPQSSLAAVGRGAFGQKDMSGVTTDKLYNIRWGQAQGELGEVRTRWWQSAAVVQGCAPAELPAACAPGTR